MRRRPILFLAFLCIASLIVRAQTWAQAPHPSLPTAGTIEGLGTNIHFTDPHAGEMAMLRAGGFRWIRMDLTWAATERVKSQYDFSAYERLLKALQSEDVRAVLILDYSNKLYEQGSSVVTTEGRAAYARWAAAAVDHFRERGVLWEIWNEPNISGFWKPKPNVDDYAAMALAACEAIHNVAPDEAIVGPATSTIDLEYLQGCFKAGLLDHWDAVSVHPYRQAPPETTAIEYHKLRQLIARYAPAGKTIPILSAEWGYSSTWQNYDETIQGKMLPRQWLINMANQIPISIWYDWHDDGTDPAEPEHHFGTVANQYHAGRDPVYDPKPAYTAAKTLTSVLSGQTFVKRIATDDPADYVMLFSGEHKRTLAVWTTSPQTRTIEVASDMGTFAAIDYLGAACEDIPVKGAVIRIKATDAPIYLTYAAENQKLDEARSAHPLRAKAEVLPDGKLRIRVDNLSEIAFVGSVRLTGQTEQNQPLALAPNQSDQAVEFALHSDAEQWTFGFTIEDQSGLPIYRQAVRRAELLDDQILRTVVINTDGDAQAKSTQSTSVAPMPEPLPGTSNTTAFRIDYDFDPGWKFLQLSPASPSTIDGKPTAFGFWVFGDGKQMAPRLRLRDSAGQTWQTSGESITWKGWRFVEFPLNSSTAHWGGDDSSQIDFPVSWEAVFLLDNPSRKKIAGSIYIAAPVVFYDDEVEVELQSEFIWPGNGAPEDRGVWGFRNGIQIGLSPGRGPHGLIRIYAPHLGQPYPHCINFISIEPTRVGDRLRDQSELASSKIRGRKGLLFTASDTLAAGYSPSETPAKGRLDSDGKRFHVFVHTETFPNGTNPIVEIVFNREKPTEIELVTHVAVDSAAMAECVLSATMGNYAQLRRIQLAGSIQETKDLWCEELKDPLGFLPWRTFTSEQLNHDSAGRPMAQLTSDVVDYKHQYEESEVPGNWRYRGLPAVQYWKSDVGTSPVLAVNARDTYWAIEKPIVGGLSIENFELRLPFQEGQRLWFGADVRQ